MNSRVPLSWLRFHLSTLLVLGVTCGVLMAVCVYFYKGVPVDANGRLCECSELDEFYFVLALSAVILPVTGMVCELWIHLRSAGREARELAARMRGDRLDS